MDANYFQQQLQNIKRFIFDIDGVLTDGMISLLPNGEQVRNMNIKDGHAIRSAIKKGYDILILSRGTSENVINRLNDLGIKDIFLAVNDKADFLEKYALENSLKLENTLYMGDDIPDYHAMNKCGIRTCPNDAADEIKDISHYVSPKNGGQGCVRDVIERVLKHNNDWSLDS